MYNTSVSSTVRILWRVPKQTLTTPKTTTTTRAAGDLLILTHGVQCLIQGASSSSPSSSSSSSSFTHMPSIASSPSAGSRRGPFVVVVVAAVFVARPRRGGEIRHGVVSSRCRYVHRRRPTTARHIKVQGWPPPQALGSYRSACHGPTHPRSGARGLVNTECER
jgi:hypothetical protein